MKWERWSHLEHGSSTKDLLLPDDGIWYVATQLGDFSEQALIEFAFLSQQHPKWLQTFQKQLSNWINQASPAEWSKLEAQDPAGKLKKLGFERSLKMLVTSGGKKH